MRAAELLAIVAICPLGIISSGCPRIEQPIGQYRASSSRSTQSNTGAASSTASSAQGEPDRSSDNRGMDASAGASSSFEEKEANTSLPDPVLIPTDSSPDAAPAVSGTAWTPTMPRACYTRSDVATRKHLDMYLVMDANVTLPYSGAWEVATTGVRYFVQDRSAAGVGVGLSFYGRECEAETYSKEPTVEIGELPANEDALVAGTMMPADYTASPMAPALEGGIQHQLERAKAHPDRKQIVVLITDGFTQDLSCRYSLQDVEDIALKGFNSEPSIWTYVIGFGAPDTMNTSADEVLARFSVLNGIAREGGGGRAFSVKFNDDPENMHDALTTIRRTAQPCAYEIPDFADPDNLNLSLFPNSFVPRVDSRAACQPTAQGFYYETAEGSERPSSIELCPASCRLLQLGDFAALLYSGCPTVRPDD